MNEFEGRQFGPYRIESRIGRGGMGDVYLAHHERLNRRCALKVLRPELSVNRDLRERFVREAQAAARLEHPNIVTIYDAGEVDGTAYFAMQYVNGQPLSTMLRDEGVSVDEALRILRDVAIALDAAHASGMVHRDVKPANIIVTPDGSAMLTDFGIVHLRPEAQLTTTGQLLGTPAYMSPEQITGGEITPQTDVYQLGVVAFELLTGALPYRATEPASLLVAHLQEAPLPAEELDDEIPPSATTVLHRALHKLPAERHPTATNFVDALDAVLQGKELDVQRQVKPADSSSSRFDATTVASGESRWAGRGLLTRRNGIVVAALILAVLGFFLARAFLPGGGGDDSRESTAEPSPTTQVVAGAGPTGEEPGSDTPEAGGAATGVGVNTEEPPARGEVVESYDTSEIWPPELEGATEFEEDGSNRIRLEAPDVSVTRQTLGANFSSGSAYLEASMLSNTEFYAEQCLLARLNASATAGYALCMSSDAETFAFYFNDEGEDEVRVQLLESMLRTGINPPSDWNELEIRARDDRFWFLVNDVLLGAAIHDGPRSGEIGVSVYREGSEPHVFGLGVLATLEVE